MSLDLLLEIDKNGTSESAEEFVEQTRDKMRQAYATVRESLQCTFSRSYDIMTNVLKLHSLKSASTAGITARVNLKVSGENSNCVQNHTKLSGGLTQ